MHYQNRPFQWNPLLLILYESVNVVYNVHVQWICDSTGPMP